MPQNPPDRPKKSKLEKICELEASLKVSKEENRKLRKELHVLREVAPGGGSGFDSRASIVGGLGDVEKMKDAVKALKRVTVSQEMSLNTMRTKARQRRDELKHKDSAISSLKRQVKSLEKAQSALANSGSDSELRSKMGELQRTCFEHETVNEKLTEKLEESVMEIRKLKKQIESGNGLLLKRENSNHSMKSMESASTKAEFDVVQLKKDLAVKSNRVVELERQIENMQDELHELRRRTLDGGFGSNSFGDFGESGSNHFNAFQPTTDDLYSEDEEDDDFW